MVIRHQYDPYVILKEVLCRKIDLQKAMTHNPVTSSE